MPRILKSLSVAAIMAAISLCASTSVSQADVTVKQTAKTSGLMGLLNTEIKTVTYLKGDMKCDDTEVKMTNKVMKFMGGGKAIKTTSVIDLANGTMLNVDHMSKSCNEMQLSEVGDMASSFMGGSAAGKGGKMPEGHQFDTSDVKMNPPKITVTKTENSEKIADHNCEEYLITVQVTGTDKESGQEFEFNADMFVWVAKGVPGYEEYKAFNQRMIDEMGFDASGSFGGSMSSMLAMYGVDSDELKKSAADIDGFPMRTIMKLKGSGGQFDKMAGGGGASEEDDESAKAASKMLSGLFGGGGDDGDNADGEYFMTVRTEVDDISTKDVKGDKFSCPNKYKSKDKK